MQASKQQAMNERTNYRTNKRSRSSSSRHMDGNQPLSHAHTCTTTTLGFVFLCNIATFTNPGRQHQQKKALPPPTVREHTFLLTRMYMTLPKRQPRVRALPRNATQSSNWRRCSAVSLVKLLSRYSGTQECNLKKTNGKIMSDTHVKMYVHVPPARRNKVV